MHDCNDCLVLQDYKDTLKGRRVFVQLVIIFRHGSEDDETMGLSFKKELILDRTQVKFLLSYLLKIISSYLLWKVHILTQFCFLESPFPHMISRSILRKVVPKRVNYSRVSFKN